MEYDGLTLQKKDGIATLTFNRPDKLNALNISMLNKLFPTLFRELDEDDDVRVLIITGAGKSFCSGADVESLTSENPFGTDKRAEKLQPVGGFAIALYNLNKPVIAAVNGLAAGGGLSIALLSDIRIASDNAKFSLVFVRRGVIPDCGASFTLPRLIGSARAFELMYTGDVIDAKEAERIGMINKVVPADALMTEVNTLAKRLIKRPPLALAQIRRAVHRGLTNDLEEQLYFESYAQNFCMNSEDFNEGVKSFLEKREPNFKGN